MANLQYLAQHNMQAKCRIRLPLIKDYNTPTNVAASKKLLSAMGFTDFDEFEYRSN
jgi:pyruvate formate lyase activating enzyme